MTTPDTITRLRKLLAEATPGPWVVRDHRSWWLVDNLENQEAFDDGSACAEYSATCSPATRDLIVEAVNSLPTLLDRLEKLEKLVADVYGGDIECGSPFERCGIERAVDALAEP